MSEHYYTENPTSQVVEKTFKHVVNGKTLIFRSVSGVFAFEDKIDKVSELLIKNFIPSYCLFASFSAKLAESSAEYGSLSADHGSLNVDHHSLNSNTMNPHALLDLGCGFGAIGLCIKSKYSDLSVTMTDINSRAVEYSKINSEINNLKAEVLNSNLYEKLEGQLFDDIVSNPPFAAGKKILEQLISNSVNHLKMNGALWLVAHHNKGGSTLKDMMENTFGNVKDIVKSGGVRVYKSIKSE